MIAYLLKYINIHVKEENINKTEQQLDISHST